VSIDDRLRAAGLPALPRPVWLEIDVAALANNVGVIRDMVGPHVGVSAVVKADAYGHGAKQVALAFESAGVDRLCVASLDEALALREAGVEASIIVLFPIPLDGLADAGAANIQVSASDPAGVRPMIERARDLPADHLPWVEVEVETGLSRGGVKVDDVPAVLELLRASRCLVGDLWTHVASPEDEEATAAQVREFERAIALERGTGGGFVPACHMAATGGLFTGRVPAYQGVRIGLGMYGLLPLDLPIPEELRGFANRLRPAMQLKCRALRVETFPPGVRVSYGGRWTAARESVIATLPIGYGDAIPRPAPWGSALVRGQRVPLVGNVAMDAVMADVTDVPAVGPDDEFVLLGVQGEQEIGTDELSRARNTIPWEVVTGMSYRIPRVYHAASVLVGLRTLNSETRVSSSRLSHEGVHGVTNDSEHLSTPAGDPAESRQ
jgi:alanine racemase